MAVQNIYVTEGTSLGLNDYTGKQLIAWAHRSGGQPGSIEFQGGQYTFVADMIDGGDNTHFYILSTASAEIAVRFVITENTMKTPVSGNAKDNVLKGTLNNDVLAGREGDDRLTGSLGNDLLDGGAGNDKIDGGEGDDTLTGFTGKDTFAFEAESGNDAITDFDLGVDVITFDGTRMTVEDILFNSVETTEGVLITFESGDTVLLRDVNFNDSL